MKKTSILTTLLLFMVSVMMAQPTNDNCADAIVVNNGDEVAFTNIDATIDGPFHPDCVSNTNDTIFADIWYSFTPDFTGFADWSMCATADFDTKIAVYNGNVGCDPTDADLLICNDDFGSCGGSTSRAVFEVTAGETYLLRLGGWGETAPGEQGSGTFTIEEFFTTIPNDFCMFAEEVFLGEDQMFTSSGATTDGPDHPNNSACFGFGSITAGQDIWYTFTSPVTGAVEWSTCDQINFDSRLVVYAPGATCPLADGDLYACNDDGSGCMNFSSRVIFDVEEGETYTLRLGGFGGESGTGFFDLVEVIPPEPPANDLCGDAAPAWLVTAQMANDFEGQVDGTTIDATFDPSNFPAVNTQCAGFDPASGEFNTVWFEFNNNGNEEIELQFIKESASLDAAYYIELFEDCDTPIDTMLYGGACLNVPEDEDFGITVMTGLSPDPTDYLLRVYTRVTTDLPGDFFFFLVADVLNSDEALPGTFDVFPNPTSKELNLHLNLEESVNATTIRVLNTLGQTMTSRQVGQLSAGQHSFQFDTENLSAGIYLLSIQSENGSSTIKFLKE